MRVSRPTVVSSVLALIAGINKHYATTTQLVIAGVTYTPASLVTALQGLATLYADVDSAEASYKAKLVAANAQGGPLVDLLLAVTAFVRASSGNSPDTLNDFGLEPKKSRKPLSSTAAAAAAAKREATRSARHTMGSNQKKAVTGTVPETGPATPASATATPTAVPTAAAPSK